MTGLAVILAWFLVPAPADSGSPAAYYTKRVGGLWLSIVEVDLGRSMIVPVSARGSRHGAGLHRDEHFVSMARRSSALAAINGCYFDGSTKRPIGGIADGGRLLHPGGGWAHLGIRIDGAAEFGPGYPDGGWAGFRMGITCLPLIVHDGAVLIRSDRDLAESGFRDRRVFARTRRSAVAEATNGRILLVTSSEAFYPAFARALGSIGVVNALGLDGGTSAALYYGGRAVVAPGRKLATILAVVKR